MNFFYFSKKHFESIFDVINFLFKKESDILLIKNVDKRSYIDFFLNYYDLSKEECFCKIKNLTNVSYIEKIPIPPKNLVKDISLLKKYCFCPIFNEKNDIIAFVSSDPFLLKSKFDIEKNIKIYLALAKDVFEAIDKIEEKSEVQNEAINNEDFIFNVFKSLIDELENKNINECLFERQENALFYSYKNLENLWKKGEIFCDIANNFWNMIKYKLINKEYLDFRNFSIEQLSSSDNLILVKWKIPSLILKNKYKIAVISDDFEFGEKIINSFNNDKVFTKLFKSFFDLYSGNEYSKEDKQNDNLVIGFDAVIIDENVLRESSQEKEFYLNKDKTKNILIGEEGITKMMSSFSGMDFYIEKSFEKDFINELIEVLMKEKKYDA